MPVRIAKKPTLSASPPDWFVSPDSTSAAMTGSSPGIPRARAPLAIHCASATFVASSPGYATGVEQSPAAAAGDAVAPRAQTVHSAAKTARIHAR